MRNDARPIGGDASHQSPVAGHGITEVRQPADVVNRESDIERPRPEPPADDKKPVRHPDDEVMPPNDATLNTMI